MPSLKLRHYLAVLITAFTLTGCAGTSSIESNLGVKDAPDWVNEGINQGQLKIKDDRYFYGFGEAPAMGSRSLQMSAADNRARANLAQVLQTKLDAVYREDEHASQAAGEQAADTSMSRSIEARAEVLLRSSTIVARWRDPNTGILYSLAELDYERHQSHGEDATE